MLTTKEIKNLTDYLLVTFKEVFATKEDLNALVKKFDHMQTSIDLLFRESTQAEKDKIITNYRLENLEKWAERAAQKIEINFEH